MASLNSFGHADCRAVVEDGQDVTPVSTFTPWFSDLWAKPSYTPCRYMYLAHWQMEAPIGYSDMTGVATDHIFSIVTCSMAGKRFHQGFQAHQHDIWCDLNLRTYTRPCFLSPCVSCLPCRFEEFCLLLFHDGPG